MFEKLSVKSLLISTLFVVAVSIASLLYLLNKKEQQSFVQQIRILNASAESEFTRAYQKEVFANQLRAKMLADNTEIITLLKNASVSDQLDTDQIDTLLSLIARNITHENSRPEVSLYTAQNTTALLTLFSENDTDKLEKELSSLFLQAQETRKTAIGLERLGRSIFITAIEPVFEKNQPRAPQNILGYVRILSPISKLQEHLLEKQTAYNWAFIQGSMNSPSELKPFFKELKKLILYSSSEHFNSTLENTHRKLNHVEGDWQLLQSNKQFISLAEFPFGTPLHTPQADQSTPLSLIIWNDISPAYSALNSYIQKLVFLSVVFLLICGGGLIIGYSVFQHRIDEAVTQENAVLQLQNKELKQSQKQLEGFVRGAKQSNSLKSSYLATMTHEIRTPMNAVIGATNMLLQSGLNDDQSEYANILLSGSDTLLAIVDDILDYSKIEANRMDLQKRPVEIAQCIEEALDQVAITANKKGLELDYYIEESVPHTILGDHARLRQILINLLSNAVKFTPKGEIELLVKAKKLKGNMHELSFAIRDTGIGIPEHKIANIFDRYSQATSATEADFGGTGLGLTICKRLAMLMGGTISVESTVNQGSTFSFSIVGKSFPNQNRNFLHEEDPNLIGRRALIVDDNEINRKLLTAQTKSWGMKSVAYSSALDALADLEKGSHFDFALLDYKMPGMDGAELADQIGRLRPDSTMPLVLLSSVGPMLEKQLIAKFSAVLPKPLKPVALFNTLLQLTGQNPAPRPTFKSPSELPIATDHPLQILVAEDNPANTKVIEIMLRKLGYQTNTTFVENGLEALDAIAEELFDVVFMDIQMPKMNGYDATRKIKESVSEHKCPKIIALTASAMETDRQKAIDAGMDDFITKPIRYTDLKEILLKSPQKHQPQKLS